MNLSAVILAGGESRRMGQDKAWLEMGGQPLIRRAVSTVRDSGIQKVAISGRVGTDYSTLGCPILFDLEPGCGPLGGIERALAAATTPLVLVLAVDLPGVTAAFLRKLAAHCDPLTGAVPKLRGELEPLAAIYPKRCHVIARDCLLKFRHAARDFAEACQREHAVMTFAISGTDAICFHNWNSPADVAAPQHAVPCTLTHSHPEARTR
jgi:molybdopterin-guanine dinucleotide biosynthesis protein A